eukprot:2668587-Heterocapsa_arctica.AAC.1
MASPSFFPTSMTTCAAGPPRRSGGIGAQRVGHHGSVPAHHELPTVSTSTKIVVVDHAQLEFGGP